MAGPFFPNPWFAWVFCAALVLILVVASYFDLRYLTIPKPLSILCVALGLAMNLVRGLWIGIENDELLLGLGDALLVSFGGFATGFGIFFGLWILGLCGGGDVKLFAGVATWLGMYYSFWLFIGSVVTLILVAGARLAYNIVVAGRKATRHAFSAKDANQRGKSKNPMKPRQRLLPYSLPLAIAAVIMLLWFFRMDLQLVEPNLPNDRNVMTSIQPKEVLP